MKVANIPRKITDLEGKVKLVNDLFTDVKAEVIAAGLIEKGYNQDYISIKRKGNSKRGWKKDVDSIRFQYSQLDREDYLLIGSYQGSIYDILPEGVFHRPAPERANKDKEDIIANIRFNRKKEFEARRFFHLFESELDKTAVRAYLHEAKYDKKISNSNFRDIFTPYWPVLKHLEPDQAVFFLHIMPLLHKIRKQLADIAEAMTLILDVPVKIEQQKVKHKVKDDRALSTLGGSKLGIDLVLGDSFDDGLFDLKVSIGPMAPAKRLTYMNNAKGQIVLDYLCQIFFPGNIFLVKNFIIDRGEMVFSLSDETRTTHLGIDTFL